MKLTTEQRLLLAQAGFTDRQVSELEVKFYNLFNTAPKPELMFSFTPGPWPQDRTINGWDIAFDHTERVFVLRSPDKTQRAEISERWLAADTSTARSAWGCMANFLKMLMGHR